MDIATLGIVVNANGVLAADAALKGLTATGARAETVMAGGLAPAVSTVGARSVIAGNGAARLGNALGVLATTGNLSARSLGSAALGLGSLVSGSTVGLVAVMAIVAGISKLVQAFRDAKKAAEETEKASVKALQHLQVSAAVMPDREKLRQAELALVESRRVTHDAYVTMMAATATARSKAGQSYDPHAFAVAQRAYLTALNLTDAAEEVVMRNRVAAIRTRTYATRTEEQHKDAVAQTRKELSEYTVARQKATAAEREALEQKARHLAFLEREADALERGRQETKAIQTGVTTAVIQGTYSPFGAVGGTSAPTALTGVTAYLDTTLREIKDSISRFVTGLTRGAVVGGLLAGLAKALDGIFNGAERARQALREFNLSMQGFASWATGNTLQQQVDDARAREAAQIQAAIGVWQASGGRESDRQRLIDQIAEINRLTDTYLDNLKKQEQQLRLTNQIAAYTATITTLQDYANSLKLGGMSTLTSTQKYAEARQQYQSIVAAALAGDQTAAGKLPAAAQAFLDASRAVNASSRVYAADFAAVVKATEDVAKFYATQRDVAQAQLDALNGVKEEVTKATAVAVAGYTAVTGGLTALMEKVEVLIGETRRTGEALAV